MSQYITINTTVTQGLAVATVEASSPEAAVEKRHDEILYGLEVVAVSKAPVNGAGNLGAFLVPVSHSRAKVRHTLYLDDKVRGLT